MTNLDISPISTSRATTRTIYMATPLTPLEITGTDQGIQRVNWTDVEGEDHVDPFPCLERCRDQLEEYFAGKRREFDLSLLLKGSKFQVEVWSTLAKIPFGQTWSYKDEAQAMGRNASSCRAIGGANGKNPISIILPCHRVIAHDGKLGGYSSGVAKKEWLLRHEGVEPLYSSSKNVG